jgi:zinc-binding in reverse transcriptase
MTKDNLIKKGWTGNRNCIFCNLDELIEHFFIHCPMAVGIWHWLASYNNFIFSIHCTSIVDLWYLDNCIPHKHTNICEMMRGAVLWVLWNERNRLIF